MSNPDWEDDLADFFDDIQIIEKCKKQTLDDFEQLCEFIAEPAFESLSEDLKKRKIKSGYKRTKKKFIDFQINFPGSRLDHFHYTIFLPKNSVELKLRLEIRGRKNRESQLEKTQKPFMEGVQSSDLLRMPKEKIIRDIIDHYKAFVYETIAIP